MKDAHLDVLSIVHVRQVDFQRRQHTRSALLLLPLPPCKAKQSVFKHLYDA